MVMCTADVHCSTPPADGSRTLCFMCGHVDNVCEIPTNNVYKKVYIYSIVLKIQKYTKICTTYVAKSRVKAKVLSEKKKRFFFIGLRF